MKKILITGSRGQLGFEFQNLKSKFIDLKFFFTDIELDIRDKHSVEFFIKKNQIDCLINTAAYTNVKKAEIEKNEANSINQKGVKNLVELAEEYKFKLIHISTDYVYNGSDENPLSEYDSVQPVNYYGLSKRNGEIHIQNSKSESIVIRTSWLYSYFGNNFVNTILKKIKHKEKIQVVNDQFGCPTNARDLAMDTIKIINSNIRLDKYGKIYNYSNLGSTNWSNFAKKIAELLNKQHEIQEVSSQFFKPDVNRPKYTITNKDKIIDVFDLKIDHWEKSLKTYLFNLDK
mgnify:CR=1 FL=1